MKNIALTLIALSTLSTAALAGRSDYPDYSDIVPKDRWMVTTSKKALIVPASMNGKKLILKDTTDHGFNSR
jgi:hypothetical protein